VITVTIHWWYLPLLFVVAALFVPYFFRERGDYDFGTPLLGLAVFAALVMAALGILIGHYL